jgi:arabinofuranosyltransferase
MMAPRKRRVWITVAFLLPFAAILIVHAVHYLPFMSDDALISLRYASRLLDGKGLTWTDGRPVEGYSNLLWLLSVAFLGLLGVDLVDATRILGGLGMIAVLFSIARCYVDEDQPRATWIPPAIAMLFVSLGAPVAVWAIGGLEQPLVGALIAISIPTAFSVIDSGGPDRGQVLALSLTLGLLCLTRPDGAIFAASSAGALLVIGHFSGRGRTVSRALLVLLFPVLLSGGQVAFRLLYYGELVPNTALVKFTPSWSRLDDGLRYLTDGARALSPFSFVAGVSFLGLLLPSRSRARGFYLLATAVAWSGYVVVIGGDIFPAYRHFVPLIVVSAFAVAEGCRIVVDRLASRPRLLYPLAAVVLLLFVPFARGQFADKHSQRAIRERWEWEGKEVGLLLKTAFGPRRPLVAVTAAGCIPYWSELPALDMLGLNDYYLPRHPPPGIGRGLIGHELGDGRYVLAQNPDIIVFSVGTEPAYRSGDDLVKTPEFHDRYVPVRVRTESGRYSAIIYVNKYSDKIGIVRSAAALRVPGYLVTASGVTAHLDGSGRLVARIAAGQAAQARFSAEAGRGWTVDLKATAPDGVIGEVAQDGPNIRLTLRSTRTEPVDVEEIVLRSPSANSTARRRPD